MSHSDEDANHEAREAIAHVKGCADAETSTRKKNWGTQEERSNADEGTGNQQRGAEEWRTDADASTGAQKSRTEEELTNTETSTQEQKNGTEVGHSVAEGSKSDRETSFSVLNYQRDDQTRTLASASGLFDCFRAEGVAVEHARRLVENRSERDLFGFMGGEGVAQERFLIDDLRSGRKGSSVGMTEDRSVHRKRVVLGEDWKPDEKDPFNYVHAWIDVDGKAVRAHVRAAGNENAQGSFPNEKAKGSFQSVAGESLQENESEDSGAGERRAESCKTQGRNGESGGEGVTGSRGSGGFKKMGAGVHERLRIVGRNGHSVWEGLELEERVGKRRAKQGRVLMSRGEWLERRVVERAREFGLEVAECAAYRDFVELLSLFDDQAMSQVRRGPYASLVWLCLLLFVMGPSPPQMVWPWAR